MRSKLLKHIWRPCFFFRKSEISRVSYRWVVGPAELARGGGGARSVESVAKATGRPRAFFSPDTD